MSSPVLDEFASKTAMLCSVVAWGLLVITFIHGAHHVVIAGRSATVVPFSILSVAALLISLISLAASVGRLKDEIAYVSTWVFVLWCSLPFFLIVGLLNPFWRRVEAAREMGYKDGSAATQIMKRLTARAAKDPPTAAQLCQLEQELQKKLSSVKR